MTIFLFQLTSRIPENLIFTLTNIGKPTIYYCWAWDSEAFEKACVSVNCFCLKGTVTSHSKTTLRVQLTPLRKVAFKNIRLTLEVIYTFHLRKYVLKVMYAIMLVQNIILIVKDDK